MIVIHGRRGVALSFPYSLRTAGAQSIKISPTLAAGDVKISKDFGALANLGTLPSQNPSSSGILQVQLDANEMDADQVAVRFIDAAGAEWEDDLVLILTHDLDISQQAADKVWGSSTKVLTAGGLDAVMVDGVSMPVSLARQQALLTGVSSGAASGTETFFHPDGTTPRVIVTVDASGNRSAISFP